MLTLLMITSNIDIFKNLLLQFQATFFTANVDRLHIVFQLNKTLCNATGLD